jgi:hypothetical protein
MDDPLISDAVLLWETKVGLQTMRVNVITQTSVEATPQGTAIFRAQHGVLLDCRSLVQSGMVASQRIILHSYYLPEFIKALQDAQVRIREREKRS